MKDTVLEMRLRQLGMNAPQARDMTRLIRDRIHPASVIAAKALHLSANGGLSGCGCGLGTLGVNIQSTAQTASYMSMGAKVGSVVPGIGTAIGAVVGGVYAALKHILGNHDVRVAAADVAACKTMLGQYMQAAAMAGPNGALGAQLTVDQFGKLFYCLLAAYGADFAYVDPRFFGVFWLLADGMAKQIAKAATTLPPGSSFALAKVSAKSDHGEVYTFGPATVQLPGTVTLQTLGALLNSLMARFCGPEGGRSAGDLAYQNKMDPQGRKCALFWTGGHAEGVQLLQDVVAYEVNNVAPAALINPNALNAPPGPTLATPAVTATPLVVQTALQVAAQNAGTLPYFGTGLTPVTDTSAALMQQQLAAQGVNMVSAPAQQVLQQVATEGVKATPAGPSLASPLTAGVGWVGMGLLGLVFLGRFAHGR